MIKRKNPTNHELLKEIKIERTIITDYDDWTWGDVDQVLYRIYDKNNKILGQARYDPKLKVIDDVAIYTLKRQGLATYLYDYIEKDLDIKLKPSKDLLSDGKAFWKNRLKKKNPTEEDLDKKLKIKKIKFENQKDMYRYNIEYYDSDLEGWNYAGAAIFDLENEYILKIEIMPYYRRKGIANYLYNYIENDWKIKLKSSGTLWPDGEKFWQARLKKNPSSKPKSRKVK